MSHLPGPLVEKLLTWFGSWHFHCMLVVFLCREGRVIMRLVMKHKTAIQSVDVSAVIHGAFQWCNPWAFRCCLLYNPVCVLCFTIRRLACRPSRSKRTARFAYAINNVVIDSEVTTSYDNRPGSRLTKDCFLKTETWVKMRVQFLKCNMATQKPPPHLSLVTH